MNTLVIRELSIMFQCCEPVIWGPTVFSAPSPIPSPICPVGTGRGDSGSLGLWRPVLRCLPAPLQEPSDPLLLSGSGAGPALPRSPRDQKPWVITQAQRSLPL